MRLGQVASLTDPGRKRRRNEDSFVVRPPLFAVADGMGGAQAGEIASRLATEALRERQPAAGGESGVASLIQAANQRVFERQSVDATASGMGTTMTVALVENGSVSIGHVGDSRAYLVRNGSLEQLTEDHSLVGELLRSGKLSPEEAETHPQRSVITRVLGNDPDVDADTFSIETEPGDLFLLCSDGLTSMVDDDEILRTVENNRDDLEHAARELVARANRGGGEDNITVIFFEIEEGVTEATDEMPALPTDEAAEDEDEDTLTELDGIPVVAAAGEHEPEGPSLRRRVAVAAIVTALLVVVAIAVVVVWELLR